MRKAMRSRFRDGVIRAVCQRSSKPRRESGGSRLRKRKRGSRKSLADTGSTIIMPEDLGVSVACIRHDCSADLTQTHTVSPARSPQYKSASLSVYDKRGAVEMRARQGAPNFQLLSEDDVIPLAGDLQPI